MLTKKTFQVAGWGKKLTGYQWLPDAPGKYPAIVFFHGLGQSLDGLIGEGVLKIVNNGWKAPYVIFSMVTGAGPYPPDPLEMKYALENDPEIAKYWDGKNVMWTGLSQGGFSTLQCAANNFPGVFVPMSSPAFDANKITGTNYKAWAFHSVNDTQCPLANVKAAYIKLGAKMTTPNDGHSNWNSYYDPNSIYGNIYEWAFGAAEVVMDPPPLPVTKKAVITILLDDGKSFYKYDDKSYEIK